MKRLVSCLMSVVLAIGLMPLPAFASPDEKGVPLSAATRAAAGVAVQSDGDAVYDVSGGKYEPYALDTIRRLYTRAVTLYPGAADPIQPYQSVSIDLQNPIYNGADIAVRYTGDRPYLAFFDAHWKGWTTVYATDANTVEAADGTDQKVAFFTLAEIEDRWNKYGGNPDREIEVTIDGEKVKQKQGEVERQCMCVCVPQSGTDVCNLVEVVAVNCAEKRIDPTQSASYKARTGMNAWQITEDIKAGYNMAGHFESHWEKGEGKDGGWSKTDLASEAHWAGVYIKRETIQNLKKEGFGAIRLPVTWYQHMYPEGDPTSSGPLPDDPLKRYHIDRAFLERVHEVVDWCIAEDMYVIVNIHHENWIDRQDLATAYTFTDLPAQFNAVWTQIAREFEGYDQHLIFEDMNEPHAWFYEEDGSTNWGFASEGSVTTVNRLNDDFVKLMRSMPAESGHQNRLLMLAHDTGGGEIAYTGFVWPDDPSDLMAASVHCYTPHNWTHYFAEGKHADEDGSLNEYTDAYSGEVEATWERIRARYTSQNYPVVLGEFGCYYYGEGRQQERREWMSQFVTHSKELGIPLFYWRMDRKGVGEDGVEHTIWSAFDEENQKISDLSSEMFKLWFKVLNNSDVRWGSLATIEPGEHMALEKGKAPETREMLPKTVVSGLSLPKDASNDEQNAKCRAYFNVRWDQIDGNEIAVKFEGNTPRIGLLNGWNSDSDWWGLAPDSVDEVNHIAYFSDDSILTRWEGLKAGFDISELDRIFVRTADSGSDTPEDVKLTTTVLAVSLIHKHLWDNWCDTGQTDNGEMIEKRVCEIEGCPAPELTRVVHEWGPWKTTKAASCTQAGEQQRSCKNHPEETQTRPTRAKGHWWNAAEVIEPSDCDKEGKVVTTCAGCDEVTVEVLPKLAHEWGQWALVSEPTCTEAGIEERVCAANSSHVDRRVSSSHPALGHVDDGGKVVREATTEQAGEIVHTCTRCGTVISRQAIARLSASGEQTPVVIDESSVAEQQPAQPVQATKGVSAKAGGTTLVVDVSSDGTATLKSAKSAKGSVKVDTVKTADGRTLKVTAVAAGAFAGSKATKITIGKNVKKIGKNAFKNCKKLKPVTIGKNVKSVGKNAFKGCKKLKTIQVRSSKLTKSSFQSLFKGTNVKLIKLVSMSKTVKERALEKYSKWLLKGVSIK